MVRMFVDGSFMKDRGAAYGIMLENDNGYITKRESLPEIKTCTQAEYIGILRGLELAKSMNISNFTLYTDYQVVVRQLHGFLLPPKNRELGLLFTQIKDSIKTFTNCIVDFVSSKHNKAHNVIHNERIDLV